MALAAGMLALAGGSVQAKSAVQKECSEKYQAAKAANTLNGQTFPQFYKQCAAEAKAGGAAASPAAPAPAVPTAAPAPALTPAPIPAAAPAPAPTAAPARTTAGAIVYPTAILPSLASEKPGKARMQTCLAQYKANKATNSNGGLKWIEQGGGYYSECNKRLKG